MKSAGLIKYGFTVLGIASLAGALYLIQNTLTFLREATSASGTVIELVRKGSNYSPVVRFVTEAGESIEFTSNISSRPPSYSEGERVEVLYRPAAPHGAKFNGFFSLWLGPIIAGALGALFAWIGGTMLLGPMLAARKQADLRRRGTRIATTLQSVEQNTSLTVNGRHPFRILTQWINPATSQIHVFESENLWFDPTAHIDVRDVGVYIERGNPKRYYVDVSFLPQFAE